MERVSSHSIPRPKVSCAPPLRPKHLSVALSGQVLGHIDSVSPVAEILHDTVREFQAVTGRLAAFAHD